jgi:uncharacterized protein
MSEAQTRTDIAAGEGGLRTVSEIVALGPTGIAPHVPPLSDYRDISAGWQEAEYLCYETGAEKVSVGFWTGEPGSIVLDPWPYTEVCSILTGRVAIRDRAGGERVFGPGEGFIVPKGWAGIWDTIESSSKIFAMIY